MLPSFWGWGGEAGGGGGYALYTTVPVYMQSVVMSDCLQLQLVVGDETGCCVAVFWNVMAPRFLN